MKHKSNILFATDFSESASPVQRYAFDFAKHTESTLHIVHVIDDVRLASASVYGFGGAVTNGVEAAKERVRAEIAGVTRRASSSGVIAKAHLAVGSPGARICEMAEELNCSLIIMGTHGRSGFSKFFFGSTCERVLHLSRLPVLTVRAQEDEAPDRLPVVPPKRILCPCDLTDLSRQAVPLAVSACRDFGASLTLLNVVDTRVEYPAFAPPMTSPRTSELLGSAREKLNSVATQFEDIATDAAVLTGVPHEEIIEFAKRADIGMVVMATHGRSGLAHALLGSTTEKVVRSVPCPVLTVRPREKSRHAEWEEASPEVAHTGQ